ncbi:response regulator [Chroococcidiopsis sp. FACHB-1243]|uniref:response regulator n=1 Tax=Chroococcidiopsis sp. [FACHB-1243] TaxID=2692781 RepID=UPI00177ED412|nr:response regulator [Chroococcidiopsis sp. [FACHB-1243]]MBD2308118.1 response regulator [Chroococcidiopsis sp. [FACHB-1243]]
MKILLVEDDETIVQLLQPTLASQRYLVELATDGQAGWELVDSFEYDLILLDVMLPKLDGINFCKKLRAKGDRTPVLLLTAQDSSTDKVRGLDAGADDYALKPFDIEELLARIRALLRRSSATPSPVLEWGFLRLDPSSCEVTYDGKLLHLTAKEYGILELLLRNTHRIFSQSALLDRVWSFDEPPTENTVRAHIKSLRQKIKKAGAPDPIETVYGLGYRLKAEEQGAGSRGEKRAEAQGSNYQLPTSQSQIPVELIPLWERHREKYIHRIGVVEQAIASVKQECLDPQLQHQAAKEAHTLIGSLGSFGLIAASQLCRQIERELSDETQLTQERIEHLSTLVATLRQNLNAVEEVKSQKSEVKTQFSPPTTNYQLPITKLLVVDSDPAIAQAVTTEATTAGMEVVVARDLSQARSAIACTKPDAVLLDLYFCQNRVHGLQFLSTLANAQPPIPTIVLTAPQSFADRVEAARLGARSFLQKPVPPAQAIAAIAQVLQASTTPEAKLMLVDDDPQLLERLQVLLEPWGFRLTLLADPQQFWQSLANFRPDLLILDIEMPQLSGIDLCQVVRNDPQWSELPIIFLSARTDAETIHRVFTIGADDYVNKPVIGPELVARVLNRLERSKIRHQMLQLQNAQLMTGDGNW